MTIAVDPDPRPRGAAEAASIESLQDPEQSHSAFPIVGIGASAGGLEALIELLQNLPADPGMAFLYVQHLEPHAKSELQEILRNVTALPAHQVTQGMRVRLNNLYVIPPNTNMALVDGSLELTPRSPVAGHHMPIDYLFRSLAAVQRARAIGVLLSGGGTDGTLGFHAIKSEGGITFAQDEKTAKQSSMPRSAAADGAVDYVLPPGEIARELGRIARHPFTKEATPTGPALRKPEAIGEILSLLRSVTNVDFSHYRRTTIQRRILRRMALRGVESVDDYVRVLQSEPAELRNLYHDLLIRVTQFFRDPEVFEALKEKVFPALLRGRGADTPIRIWVPGCATGEEVYSLAIALLEYLDGRQGVPPVKILATDISDASLEKARSGTYIDNIEIDVSRERLRRFFVRADNHYQISKTVRDLCVFSHHNVTSDPPFSRIDLVSCRNVLIYMNTPLQKRVLPVLHYSLNTDGFLLLGGSESIGGATNLFGVVDAKHRIFVKKPVPTNAALDFSAYLAGMDEGRRPAREQSAPLWNALDVQREADRILLARYAPVGVVIDETLTVLQFRGRTSPYLEAAPGMASLDFLRMLREGLLAEVRMLLTQAKAGNVPVAKESLLFKENGEFRQVKVEVIPFKVPPSGVRCFLVLFQEAGQAARPAAAAPRPSAPPEQPAGNDQLVTQLQQELTALREYLQTIIEEHESTNEELKSANEEILSANEELQSTNEELQTAKEEAQSANEELITVNDELRHRNFELSRLNSDLINVLSGVNIPIVLVGRDLRVRRFTPLAEKVFNLIPSDVGRPLSDIKPNLRIADVAKLITEVIDSVTPHESEVQDAEGHRYFLRIRPYVTVENKIDGASVTLLDIDSFVERLEQRRQGRGNPPV